MSDQRVRWLEEYCHVCGRQLNSWDARVSKALGYRHKLCEGCIAERAKARLEKNADDVLITGCMREKERQRKKLGR